MKSKLTCFTRLLESSLLGCEGSNWTRASSRQTHSTWQEGGTKRGWRTASDPVRARCLGLMREHNPPAGGQRRTRGASRLFGHSGGNGSSSSGGGGSSGLLRLPLHQPTEPKTLVNSVCLGHAQSMPVYRCSASSGKPHPVTYLPPSLFCLFSLSI